MKDQLGRTLHLDTIPKRIVSLVPSQTELLFDLGLEASIVGITKFCVHPAHFLKEKTIVGGTKQVHVDKIKALQPDIILCNKEENTLKMIQELESIAPVHISDVVTIPDCLELVQGYGNIFSVEEKATDIMQDIELKYTDFKGFIEPMPLLKTAYFIWKKPWIVVGSGTFINSLLQLNHFENYYGTKERYPKVTLTTAQVETADVVLLSSEPFPFKQAHKKQMQEFFPHAKVLIVDGEAFSWYGSRLIKAFDYFKSLHQGPLKNGVSNSK